MPLHRTQQNNVQTNVLFFALCAVLAVNSLRISLEICSRISVRTLLFTLTQSKSISKPIIPETCLINTTSIFCIINSKFYKNITTRNWLKYNQKEGGGEMIINTYSEFKQQYWRWTFLLMRRRMTLVMVATTTIMIVERMKGEQQSEGQHEK